MLVEPKRVLFTTIGSLGDLHPCLALGVELRRRGHKVTVAAIEFYRGRVEELGLGFRPLRPNWDPTNRELIRQCEDLKSGPEVLFRKLILPELEHTFEDLLAIAADADVMIAGELVFAAPLVAEKLGLRWVSAILSPCSFFSSHDPSIMVNVPWLIHLRKLGRPVYRAAFNAGRRGTRHWWKPVRNLRQHQGLGADCDPLFRDKFSPDLVLALFSKWLARRQPDWPPQTRQPGFVYLDRKVREGESAADLDAFLSRGEPPIVFTLGSTAVHSAGDFFAVSAEAAGRLGKRAILLGDDREVNSPSLMSIRYASYAEVFPRAAAVVHQGGSGTTAQALRAGRPMLIVPFGWDQPDNGVRVARKGAGLSLARKQYSADAAATALRRLLHEPSFALRAAEAAAEIATEHGLEGACDEIQLLLSKIDGR
jgi:rhamnosyltransferase subunit B